MNWHLRFVDRIRTRLIIQIVIIMISGALLFFSLFEEIPQAISHIRWRQAFVARYTFTVLFNFVGVVLPMLFLLLLCRNIIQHLKLTERQISPYKALVIELHGNAGVLLLLIIPLSTVYLIIEGYYPFSVIPLITPVCALLGITTGYWIVRKSGIRDKLTSLALLLALILTTRYVDWNPRKPLVRDMYRVRVGMTVDEVDSIMGKYKYRVEESQRSESESFATNPLIYMTDETADMVTINIKDGKVERIQFSHD